MSSLRNAVKRKTHKERSQPAARARLGLLEKKKDYVLRARDFHKKEDAIKVLKTKAAYRNPDEFYFGMEKQRTIDGVHQARGDESNKYTAEELRLMKTQDVKYVGLKASMEAKKAEKLRATLHLVGADGLAEEDESDDEMTRGWGSDDERGAGGGGGARKRRTHVKFGSDDDDDDDDDDGGGGRARTRGAAVARDDDDDDDDDATPGPASAAEDKAAARRKMRLGLGLRRDLARGGAGDDDDAASAETKELDPRLKKRLEKKRRVAYQLLKERESRAAKLKMMTSEMAYQKEVQSARGHKRKIKREKDEEDALPGLAHLKKAPAQFKWKRKRLK
jgi:hypothetical protein